MKKALFGSFLVLLVTLTAFPQKMVVTGLTDEVTVRRDGRGIPYIEAKNDTDLYFAQGYITASDRLWQMDMMRRVVHGETSELFGNQALEGDKRWRRFGFAEINEQAVAQMDPEIRKALTDYARGVNAYIATLDDNTKPVEFKILQYKPREWRPADSVAIGKLLADALSTTWQNDILRASLQSLSKEKLADVSNFITPYDVVLFGKDTKPAAAAAKTGPVSEALIASAEKDAALRSTSLESVGLYAEGLAASNNWVISGKRTADGKPILANDPHLSPNAPGIWYLIHLSSPTLRVSGVSVPGGPGVALGHNEYIAWGATNVGPDVQDVYFETFNEKGEYKTPTGWSAPVVRKEMINVRSNLLKPETAPVAFEATETRNGVIISEEGGKKYALKWTARDAKNNEFEAYFLVNRAKNWDEFKRAFSKNGGPMQNFIYADVKGNIGWFAAGRVPIRKTGDGGVPYDGSTTDGDWTGHIPADELPMLYNPPDGLIVTANQRITGTSYKYTQITRGESSVWRAYRIHELLAPKTKVTMDDVRDVQHDVYNRLFSNLAKQIVKLEAASPETLEVLRNWDGNMSPDSRGAVLTNTIIGCLANNMANDNKPVPAYIFRERIIDWAVPQQTPRWLPAKFANYTELIKSCDASSRASLASTTRLGTDPANWTWGKLQISRFPHQLAVAPLIGAQFMTPTVPLGGSGQTPNVGSGVSMRHIASPGNWDATRHVIPLGQSGDPKSPHFKDQFEAWRTGTPMIFPFSKAAVEKATVGTWVLSPK